MHTKQTDDVVLVTPDVEVCVCPLIDALAIAHSVARELKTTITIRDPITDRVYKTVKV